jgi:hypothetical protein
MPPSSKSSCFDILQVKYEIHALRIIIKLNASRFWGYVQIIRVINILYISRKRFINLVGFYSIP